MTSFRACSGGAEIFGTFSRDGSAGRCHYSFHSPCIWLARCLWTPFLTLSTSTVLVLHALPWCSPMDLPFPVCPPGQHTSQGVLAAPHQWVASATTNSPPKWTPYTTTPSKQPNPPQSAPTPGGQPHTLKICSSCS